MKTDEDYIKLDEAIGTLNDWYKEIAEEMQKRGLAKTFLSAVIECAANVHSPTEETTTEQENIPNIFEDVQ